MNWKWTICQRIKELNDTFWFVRDKEVRFIVVVKVVWIENYIEFNFEVISFDNNYFIPYWFPKLSYFSFIVVILYHIGFQGRFIIN